MALSKTRILSWLAVALALLNVGLLALLWLGRPGNQPPQRPASGSVAGYLVRELQLTPAQQQQFDRLRQDHHAHMQRLVRELTTEREQLFAGLAQPGAAAAAPALLDRIGRLQRQTDSITYAHFAAVGQLLTPAQRKRWQQLAPTLPRRLQPPGPGGPPAERGSADGPPPPRS